MASIRIKEKTRDTIRKLERTVTDSKRLKQNLINVKDKLNGYSKEDEENEIEYVSNKYSDNINYATNKSINTFNKYGQNAVKETKENIYNTTQRVKAFKNKVAKNKEKDIFKRKSQKAIKSAKGVLKSSERYIKMSKGIKTSENVVKTTEKMAKETAKVSQKVMQRIKVATRESIKATKLTIRAVINAIKAIINATKVLVAFLIAGAWIIVVIIIVICMIAFLLSSVYGIFFAGEDVENGTKSMSSVISELNQEYMNKISKIQLENSYEEFDINGTRAEWKEVLAVYSVKLNSEDKSNLVMILNENNINALKNIFWEMNEISFTKDVTTEQKVIVHLTWTEYKTITHTKLHINITSKSAMEMVDRYNFNSNQRKDLQELLNDEYASLWSSVIYGSTLGSNDIVQVAISQLGNIGGQPYWSWYGYESRVSWCACFVSYCANECGYIEAGIIPKFASCQIEGIAWFKACGLWKEAGYIPKSGDIIFFDWEQDGTSDHVGIVEKVENGIVYTIEGNTNDSCARRNYDINSKDIVGYGTPMY